MSLEEALARNTDALEKLNTLLTHLNAKADSKSAGGDTGRSVPAKDKDGAEPEPRRGRGRPAGSTKVKVPSTADMKAAATEFLDIADEEEFKSRKAALKEIVDSFGAAKFTEIAEEDRVAALAQLKDAEKGGEGDDLV